MKNLILFSLFLLFTASCKKNKTTKPEENINIKEKKVLKKLRIEFNMIKGDYKNFDFLLDISHLTLNDGSYGEPIIIKPANLKFTEKNKLTGNYTLDVDRGKVEKNYIIESKEPVQEGIITFGLTSIGEEDKENPMIEIKIFADGKQIESYNHNGLTAFQKIIEMNKYF